MIPGTQVVKAFNTVFSDLLTAQSTDTDSPVPVYVAGDDADAREQVVTFVENLGMVAIESGPLSNTRHLEPMAEMMFQLGYLGSGIAGFRLLSDPCRSQTTVAQ